MVWEFAFCVKGDEGNPRPPDEHDWGRAVPCALFELNLTECYATFDSLRIAENKSEGNKKKLHQSKTKSYARVAHVTHHRSSLFRFKEISDIRQSAIVGIYTA